MGSKAVWMLVNNTNGGGKGRNNGKRVITKAIFIAMLVIGCTRYGDKSVNLKIDESSNGWYIIRVKVDRVRGSTGSMDLNFGRDERFRRIVVKEKNDIVFHVYDKRGNDISKLMEHVAIGATDTPHAYFCFYFPARGEPQSELFYTDSTNDHYYEVSELGSRLKDSLRQTDFW
ncbi:MAG: hypothetical protein KF744_16790 [Taibaiella sp.]|nr:hypothetical protein [Taibaiella sp.]